MSGLVIDFDKYLKRIPTHSVELGQEAATPASHYSRSANDAWSLLRYVERNLAKVNVYDSVYEPHMRRLSTMVMLALVETFERFLKEVAAVCVNHVGQVVLDDRLDAFSARGSVAAAHFGSGDLGKALCESLTWCDCDDANRRFRKILADPFQDDGKFFIFPNASQLPVGLRNRAELMRIVWQLRHTIAHNAGLVTSADARKFGLLVKRQVHSPRLLEPTKGDVWYVKLFLDETVELINLAVAQRLSELLATIYAANPSLFDAAVKAKDLANLFGVPITIAGFTQQPR